MLALGIGRGDKLLHLLTRISYYISIIDTGATPVLLDINEKTYNLDESLIEKSISKKTKAIIPVHIYGQSCNMSELKKLHPNIV